MKKILCAVLAAAMVLTLNACQSSKDEGILTMKEVEVSESLYGKNRDDVFETFKLTEEDITASQGDAYLQTSKTRMIEGLSFMQRLAFNYTETDPVYAGEDLAFVSLSGEVTDDEILKALKKIYKAAVKLYGEPDNDPAVGRQHLEDLLNDPSGEEYDTWDTWNLSDQSELTVSAKAMASDNVRMITLSYRPKRVLPNP